MNEPKTGSVQLANREINNKIQLLLIIFKEKNFLQGIISMVVAGSIIGLLAPFGMVDIALPIALSFWILTCVIGYVIYSPMIDISDQFLTKKIKQRWQRIAIGALIASVIMSFVVPLLSALFFNVTIDYLSQVGSAFIQTSLIGGVITIISLMRQLIGQQREQLAHSQKMLAEQKLTIANSSNQQLDELMAKVPLEKRGKLLCLEMDDHYLRIYTSRGEHLTLMRFKDALSLLQHYEGLQTHRSWWVATDAIVGVQKEGRKTLLRLSNDVVVPVSRTFQAKVNELGVS
ncbi:MAG: hypothetical protein BM565_04930 [Gammaproteobacteria bacterium MedPE]|nr:MAG: hypothetical protein BM565_04930 [Gammaproteobacteria bacterium MedPE]